MCALAPTAATETLAPTVVIVTEVKMRIDRSKPEQLLTVRKKLLKLLIKEHCWEGGPETDDGCSTTCMLPDGHDGAHEWSRDDEYRIRIKMLPE